MVKFAIQELPELQDSSFLLRTMENDRYQSQVQQPAQYPGQFPILLFSAPIFKRNMQRYINQKDDPYSLIQNLYFRNLIYRQRKAVFINHSDN